MVRRTPQPKTPWPENFYLTAEMRLYAVSHGISNPALEFEHFENHHKSKGNVFASWEAAWRTWVLRSGQFRPIERQGRFDGKALLRWHGQEIVVEMRGRRELPSLDWARGASADDVAKFLQQKGFGAYLT